MKSAYWISGVAVLVILGCAGLFLRVENDQPAALMVIIFTNCSVDAITQAKINDKITWHAEDLKRTYQANFDDGTTAPRTPVVDSSGKAVYQINSGQTVTVAGDSQCKKPSYQQCDFPYTVQPTGQTTGCDPKVQVVPPSSIAVYQWIELQFKVWLKFLSGSHS